MVDFRNFYQDDRVPRRVVRITNARDLPASGYIRLPRQPTSEPFVRMPPDALDLSTSDFTTRLWGQPVFGYFQGGGWAFGTTENQNGRIPVEVYDWYMNPERVVGQTFTFQRRDGELNSSPLVGPGVTIVYGVPSGINANDPSSATLYLPKRSDLSPLDNAGLIHDYELAQVRRLEQLGLQGLVGGISLAESFDRQRTINQNLLDYTNSYEPEVLTRDDFSNEFMTRDRDYEQWRELHLNEIQQRDFLRRMLPFAMAAQEWIQERPNDVAASFRFLMTLASMALEFGFDPASAAMVFGGQCFGAGTQILLADGSTKPIERVDVGDWVASFDPNEQSGRGPLTARRVVRLLSSESKSVVDLDGLLVTSGHQVLSSSGEFVALESLAEDEFLVNADGTLRPAGHFERIRTATKVYNFEVEGLHTYVAGGIRVHNDSGTVQDGTRQIYARVNEPGLPDMSFIYDKATRSAQVTIRDAENGRTIQQTLVGGLILKAIYQNGTGDFGPEVFGLKNGVFAPTNVDLAALMRTEAFSRAVILDYNLDRRIELGGDIAYQFGSTLGRLLSDDQFTSLALGVVLGTVSRNLGEAIANGGFNVDWAVHVDSNVLDDFAAELGEGSLRP